MKITTKNDLLRTFKIYDPRHAFTPFVIDWVRQGTDRGFEGKQWKTLFVFGVRIASWRVDV